MIQGLLFVDLLVLSDDELTEAAERRRARARSASAGGRPEDPYDRCDWDLAVERHRTIALLAAGEVVGAGVSARACRDQLGLRLQRRLQEARERKAQRAAAAAAADGKGT